MVPQERYDPAAVIAAIEACKGMISAAAKMLGCDRGTITDMSKRRPEVQAAIEQANDMALDLSELALFKGIQMGEPQLIKFHLKCKGRARGYIEKSDVVLSGGVTLEDIITRSLGMPDGRPAEAAPLKGHA